MRRALPIVCLTTLAVAGLVLAACTMKKQEAPPLTGPSEFGTSITIQAAPDVITQDGASQSLITITARDASGQPLRNVTLRVETFVNGERVDFGTLSARTVVTGSDGRATLTYTAPPGVADGVDQLVQIAVTPIGGDHSNNLTPRTSTIKLVPQGVVLPPSGLNPAFTRSPATPVEGQQVQFDATASLPKNGIASYAWNFGDGDTASGPTVTHAYDEAGSYFATLTITDNFGRSASTTQGFTVSGGVRPRAVFEFSPGSPVKEGSTVRFDASDSKPSLNATITTYQWTFGDTATVFTTSNAAINHTFNDNGDFTVTLTIRDSLGVTAIATGTISVIK